jgi:hypothetical protein
MNNDFDILRALESSAIMSAVVVFALSVLAAFVLVLARRYLDNRIADMKYARELLSRHLDSVGVLVNDHDVSDHVKLHMLAFSESVSDREAAHRTAVYVMSKTKIVLSKEVAAEIDELDKELKDLGRTRPDLASAFGEAVGTGFMSMVLRLPRTHEALIKANRLNFVEREEYGRHGNSYATNQLDLAARVMTANPKVFANPGNALCAA